MGRRALFLFRFYGALRRLKHRATLPKIDDGAQKFFVAQVSLFWGAQAASLFFSAACRKPWLQFNLASGKMSSASC
jgi:hypothetical protein